LKEIKKLDMVEGLYEEIKMVDKILKKKSFSFPLLKGD